MTPDEERNASVVLAMEDEIFNRRNLVAIDRYIAPSYTLRTAPAGAAIGRDGVREAMEAYVNAFSDLHVDVEELMASEDRVVAVLLYTGTHDGDMFGISPTGRRIAIRQIAMYRLAGGQITDEWEVSDQMGLMQQLGVISDM